MMELQAAYDELKSRSESEISDLRVQLAGVSPSASKGKCRVFLSHETHQALLFGDLVKTRRCVIG